MDFGLVDQQRTMFASGIITRDYTTADNTQAVTGIGFTPRAIIAITADTSGGDIYFHMSMTGDVSGNSSSSSVTRTRAGVDNSWIQTDQFVTIAQAGSNNQAANWVSFDTDGFTIDWVKTNSPTGTFSTRYMCLA
jgi:hypothetical protein